MQTGFLTSDKFHNCADLDGAEAARYLTENGARVVCHGDLGTNGIAIGFLEDGRIAALSTNGHLTICEDRDDLARRLPRSFALLSETEAVAGDFPIDDEGEGVLS